MRTAVLVDGGFFIRRFPKLYPAIDRSDADATASELHRMCLAHLRPPPRRNASGERVETEQAVFRHALHDALRRQRKVALRLGHLDEKNAEWTLRLGLLKSLLKGDRTWSNLTDDDFQYYARQEVVDLKIGATSRSSPKRSWWTESC